jgi:hypothetical protein
MSRDEIDDDDDDDWRRRMVRRAQAFARPDCVAQRMVTEFEDCIDNRVYSQKTDLSDFTYPCGGKDT